jgi:hypothetical protein
VKRPEERADIPEERAELLPDRTTLAAFGFSPSTGVSATNNISSPVGSNVPSASPASNNAIIEPGAQTEISGGFMPVVLTIVPSLNFITQNSADDGSGAAHPVSDQVASIPLGAGHDVPWSGGGHQEDAPVESAPLHSAPLDRAPLDSAPLDSAPLDSAPLDSAPADGPYGDFARWIDLLRRFF